jgi:tetratricopeptide (TPR) repeat protein
MTSDAVLREPGSTHGAATLTGQITSAELRSGDLLGGRFRIESLLGVGGMGVVYRARDLSLDIDVALKLLRPELARKPDAFERFRKELLLARQVSSPHVVRIHDIAEAGGRWFISMDFIDGESLEGYRDRVGKIPVEGALAVTHALLDGLSAAHARGVIHRDLKPANVLLDKTGHAYITDFGVARSLGATGMTQSGIIVGTPEYLSPEQARGDPADARSDLYTTGLILYEMLTGALPFAGGTPAETVIQRIVRPPPSLAKARPDLPRWLHAFTDRLLKVSPAHRFASAKEALRALETKHVPRPPLNRRLVFVATLIAVAVAGAGAYFSRHPLPLREMFAPIAPATPRVAVMPFAAPDDDADLAAVARAFEAHAQAWLRSDPSLAIVTRPRVQDALARTASDLHGEALVRQLPSVARAASASQVLTGDLKHTPRGLALELSWIDAAAPGTPTRVTLEGADAAALYNAWTTTLPAALRSARVSLAAPPPMPAVALATFGRGLLALDKNQPADAATELSKIENATPPSALVDSALLDAEERAGQDLPAQNTRDRVLKQFAGDGSPVARSLRALARASDDEQAPAAASDLAGALKAFPHDPELAMQRAEALAHGGESEQAIAALQAIVGDDDQNARAWFLLGRTSIVQGQAQRAVDEYLVRAVVLNTRARNQAAEAETRNTLGWGYERLGQIDAAIEQYTRAAAMREALGDRSGQAKSMRNLAIVEAEQGRRELAERHLDEVAKLLEGLGDRASLADLYNDRGVVAEERGDFQAALAAYREALAIRQQLDRPALVAESLDNVGFSAFQLGQLDNAFVYWQQALALFKQLDDRNRALHIEQSMSLLDIARGHFAAARDRLQATLNAAESYQLPEETSVARIHLAELALAEGRFASAAQDAETARQILARRADMRGQAEANLLIARASIAVGDAAAADKAIAAIPEADIGDEQRVALLLVRARRAALGGDNASASKRLEDAAKSAADIHAGVLSFRIRIEQARLALATGDEAGAGKLIAGLRAETTLLGQVPLHLDLLELEIAAALRSGRRNDATTRYREALSLLKDTGRFASAATLHALGARAAPAGSADAAAATEASESARAALLADAPPAAKATLEREIDLRLKQDVGDAR